MSTRERTLSEQETVGRPKKHTAIMTTDGTAGTTEDAMVKIHDLDMSVTRMLLDKFTCTSVIWIIVQRIGLLLWMEQWRERLTSMCRSAQSRTDENIHQRMWRSKYVS